jgi:hypothetical protein
MGMRKPLLALFLSVFLSIGAMACGGASKSASSASQTSSDAPATSTAPATTDVGPPPKRPGIDDTYDEDDTAPRKVEDRDDEEVEHYGQAANAVEAQSAAAFAKSYFAAAVAEDGATACTLLTPSLASGIGGSYNKPPNPTYLHGNTCAEVMTKLFKHRHKLMTAEAAGLQVTAVRVTSRTAFILLAFKGIRERRFMGVERTGKAWKLEALIDSQYP